MMGVMVIVMDIDLFKVELVFEFGVDKVYCVMDESLLLELMGFGMDVVVVIVLFYEVYRLVFVIVVFGGIIFLCVVLGGEMFIFMMVCVFKGIKFLF